MSKRCGESLGKLKKRYLHAIFVVKALKKFSIPPPLNGR